MFYTPDAGLETAVGIIESCPENFTKLNGQRAKSAESAERHACPEGRAGVGNP